MTMSPEPAAGVARASGATPMQMIAAGPRMHGQRIPTPMPFHPGGR